LSSQLYLIVGLGNPGLSYKHTRHNVGFMALDFLGKKHRLKFEKDLGPSRTAKFSLEKRSVLLMKPLTFMNLSGQAVKAIASKKRIYDLATLLVICDDINLPFAELRLRGSGSAGGQKGLISIISQLGTSEFARLRIGIGCNFSDAADYVLSPFLQQERKELPLILEQAAVTVESFVLQGLDYTMTRYNKNILQSKSDTDR
jgi:PTH1 family peptidyl-tRNA hydrolase